MASIYNTWRKNSYKNNLMRVSNNTLTPDVEAVAINTFNLAKEIVSNFEKSNVLDNGIYWDCPLVFLIDTLEKYIEYYQIPEDAIKDM